MKTTNKYTRALLAGREQAPTELRGVTFDAWLFDLILDSLEPVQRDILEWLLVGEPIDALCTSDLCIAARSTPTRLGAALSRLRRLGLIETYHKAGDDNLRRAYHIAVPWVIAADRMRLQWDRETVQAVLEAARGEPG